MIWSVFLILGILIGVYCFLILVLMCVSLKTNDVDCLIIYLCTTHKSSLVSAHIFFFLKNWVVCFFIESYLPILSTSPFQSLYSVHCFLKKRFFKRRRYFWFWSIYPLFFINYVFSIASEKCFLIQCNKDFILCFILKFYSFIIHLDLWSILCNFCKWYEI